MAFISNTSPITSSEDINSKMDLDRDNMEEEMHADISDWTLAKRKKLQNMFNAYTVTITFLMFLKKIFYKREKLQLIHIAKLFCLTLLVMMTL